VELFHPILITGRADFVGLGVGTGWQQHMLRERSPLWHYIPNAIQNFSLITGLLRIPGKKHEFIAFSSQKILAQLTASCGFIPSFLARVVIFY